MTFRRHASRRTVGHAAALIASLVLISALVGTVAAAVGPITVQSGPTPNPVTSGGIVSYSLTVQNTNNDGSHFFAVTDARGASNGSHNTLSVASSPCVSIGKKSGGTNGSGDLANVQIQTSSNGWTTPAGDYVDNGILNNSQITITVTEYDLTAAGCDPLHVLDTRNVRADLHVVKADQTITFNQPADQIYGTAAFNLTASASSGLTVGFTASPSGHCTVNGSTLTIKGAGDCTVTASQGGNGSYNAAVSVPQTFTIIPAPLTVTASDKTRQFGLTNPNFTYKVSGFQYNDNNSDVSGQPALSTSADTSSPVGDYDILVSQGTLSAANYTFGFVKGTLHVTTADQAIDFAALPDVFVDQGPITLTATATSGLPVAFKAGPIGNCTVSGNVLTLVSTGNCKVTASQSGDTNYNAADNVSHTFSISKRDQAITFAALPDVKMGVDPITLVATSSSGLPVRFKAGPIGNCTVSGNVLTIVSSGNCKVTALQDGDANYNAADDVAYTFSITKTDQTIDFAPLPDVQFSNTPITLSATATSGLEVSFAASPASRCTVSGNVLTLTGLGKCRVTASQDGNDYFYAASPRVTQVFDISQGSQVIHFTSTAPSNAGVGGSYTAAATSDSGLTVALTIDPASTGCSIDGTNLVTFLAVGHCIVDANQGGTTLFAAAAQVQQQFDINLNPQTVHFTSIPPLDPKVGGSYTAAATSTSGLPVTLSLDVASDAGACSIDGANVVSFTGAGDCVVDANQPGDAVFGAAPQVQQAFDITLNSQDIDFPTLPDVIYGAGPITLDATAPGGTVLYGVSGACTLDDTTLTITGVGICIVTAAQGGGGGTAPAAPVTHLFRIDPATLTIAATNKTKTAGHVLVLDGTTDFTTAGLVGTDTVTSVTLDSAGAAAGATVVGSPYVISIDAAVGTGLGNYTITYVNGQLTVTAKPVLTVTANDQKRDFGKANPALTYTITGFEQGDNAANSVTSSPSCTTTATAASLPGTYPITCSGAGSAKYEFTYVAGTLTVRNAVAGATATPVHHPTPPTTSTGGGSNNDAPPAPLLALLICLAFGGLGLLAVQAQRRSMRS